jgi:broad specificity phosphatase PhoE
VIILARHGQTAANADGLLLGRADPPLTVLGRQQAEAIRGALASTKVARVVTSPLQRAMATASVIADGHPVDIDDRWIELDYGDYDGLPFRDVPVDIWAKWRADPNFRPPNGESFAEVAQRVRAACEDLIAEGAERDILVVSHVSPVKEAVAWALGVGGEIAWRMRLDVAAITRIGASARGPSLLSFNETAHLSTVS